MGIGRFFRVDGDLVVDSSTSTDWQKSSRTGSAAWERGGADPASLPSQELLAMLLLGISSVLSATAPVGEEKTVALGREEISFSRLSRSLRSLGLAAGDLPAERPR